MQDSDFKAAEKIRYIWLGVIVLGLAAEAVGIMLLMKGRGPEGVVCASAGMLVWLAARFVGTRQYTKACARMTVEYGLGVRDARAMELKRGENPGFPIDEIVPPGTQATGPLFMFPVRGRWHGFPLMMAETTVSFQDGSRQFMSGTLAILQGACEPSGLLALYGKPYGGIPLSRFEGFSMTDTGDRSFLLLNAGGAEVSDRLLDTLSGLGGGSDRMAILRVRDDCLYVFLPRQFYSGSWALFRPMTESALKDDPLPGLQGLDKIARQVMVNSR